MKSITNLKPSPKKTEQLGLNFLSWFQYESHFERQVFVWLKKYWLKLWFVDFMRYTKFLKDTCRLLGTQNVSGFDTSKIHFTTSLDFVSISQWQSQGHRLPWDLTRFKSSETKEKTSEAQTQQIQLTVEKLLEQNQDHLDVSKDDECDRKKMNCKTPKSQWSCKRIYKKNKRK